MPDFGLYAERDPLRATRILERIERFAERRARFLNALDMRLLSVTDLERIFAADEELDDALAFGTLYVEHLFGLDLERQLHG